MSALVEAANGTFVLHPWCMPRSLDEDGEARDQGRYCIAYSRDGWWLIDADEFVVLRWCVSEEAAVAARAALLTR